MFTDKYQEGLFFGSRNSPEQNKIIRAGYNKVKEFN